LRCNAYGRRTKGKDCGADLRQGHWDDVGRDHPYRLARLGGRRSVAPGAARGVRLRDSNRLGFRCTDGHGTGYSREFLESFQARLERIEQDKPTAVLPKGTYMRARVHWVKPRYLAQVEFTEWTRDNILRHPSFLGLREDKDPRDVVVGRPALEPPGVGRRS
jgi:hypothetical protein